ncbi:MAG: S-layer homology domain-containing protein [Limnospira sp. PMC 1291.21]|uniref:S-layer homology domain-containing protein n=1 Tax=unclassified Limnospira TaxID=2642885 RepID=UPI0028E12724|nr:MULTISPECIES: S-layer homology domain-containing protein [unclassified Limnospira]MDT9177964.1 S-layer homology domain-containing protein [Limnospira sp. PMC 1238.20]MDT9193221.1 S-layer homology domain-containing protein [Limnospira sp. PMC 1245.20]MDT9203449.1 S-layer homology domain-containing protein [Limnospira sp. PMC 1243.20]MDT9208640.1 S-layer homology domain-containing protein [Limnospira sp. PMC 1252.20]MDT9213807.1 S-layer homology domain-containing protein [Limnospira sp. PMC 1
MKTNRWHIILTLVAAIAVLITHPSQTNPAFPVGEAGFTDVQNHWAQPCIKELADRQIITGYSDNTFRPNNPITRAEFAALVNQAFPRVQPTRRRQNFVDIPTDFWAYDAISLASQKGFLSGYIGSVFNPLVNIPRVQALVAISNGLGFKPQQLSPEQLGDVFIDSATIPDYAKEAIAAATENWLVVNYPNVRQLQPNRPATRADVATFICQAITNFDENALVPSQYIARISVDDQPLAKMPLTTPETQAVTESEPAETPSSPADISINKPPETPSESPQQIPHSPPTETQFFQPPSQALLPQEPINKTIEFENLLAEFDFNPRPSPQFSLKITRRGEVVLDDNIPEDILKNLISSNLDTIRLLDVRTIDLNGDREPELIVDLQSGGYYSLIYHYRPLAKQYGIIPKSWGIWHYDLTEITDDGLPRFVGYDYRFAREFNLQSQSQVPLIIWEYRAGQFQNVTANYPEFVTLHLDRIWRDIEQRHRQNQDVRGVIAAYMANQYSLGQGELGWRKVRSLFEDRNISDLLADVTRFLQDTGYIQP